MKKSFRAISLAVILGLAVSSVPAVAAPKPTLAEIEAAKKVATEIGFPVLIKASAGGGGKGMRPCFNEADVKANFAAVQREALSSFGYAGLLVEKYV